jgi:hypothetical protein
MTYFATHDTPWDRSKKGNLWRRLDGAVLVVGEKSDGSYWAMRDREFIRGYFETLEAAQHAAERNQPGEDEEPDPDDRWWD